MYCKNCGAKVTDKTNYCENCGYPTSQHNDTLQDALNPETNHSAAPKKQTSSWRAIAVIIGLLIVIACAAFLFLSADSLTVRPSLKGNTYEGYYQYDDQSTPIDFTITFNEHRLGDISGTIEDDEYGEAVFYGRFTGSHAFYFNKNYEDNSNIYTYKYEGIVDYDKNLITGTFTKNDGKTQGEFVIDMG